MSDIPTSNAPAAPAAPAATPTTSSAPAPAAAKGSAPAAQNTTAPQGANSVKTDAPAVPGVTETPAEKKARKYQIKVDGQAREIDLDSMNDEELVKRVQLAEAAQRRMQEASEQRKQVESLFKLLKENPIEALKNPALGVDVRKMVEDQILREYEEAQLSEPERKAKELERQLQAREAKIQEYEQAKASEAQRQLEERVFQETQRQFVAALDAADLPRNQETIYMMADVARLNLENGIELSPAQMAAEVKDRLSQMHTHIVRGLDGEKLMSYLGDDVITKVLKYAVERVKAQENNTAFKPPVAQTENDLKTQTANDRRRDMRDARKYFRR